MDSQITVDSRTYNVVLQSLEDANNRLRRVEQELEKSQKTANRAEETVKRLKASRGKTNDDFKQSITKARTALEEVVKQLNNITTTSNGLFRELVRRYPNENITVDDNTVYFELPQVKNYGCSIQIKARSKKKATSAEAYKVSPHFALCCLHFDEHGFPCGGKLVADIDSVCESIEFLRTFLPTYLTDQKVNEIIQQGEGKMREFISALRTMVADVRTTQDNATAEDE